MIDYIILTAYSPFAVIMQLHAGWIRFLQTRILGSLGCLWFNRNEVGQATQPLKVELSAILQLAQSSRQNVLQPDSTTMLILRWSCSQHPVTVVCQARTV